MGNSDRISRSTLPAERATPLSAVALQRGEQQNTRSIQPVPAKQEASDSRAPRLETPERWDGLS